MESIERKIRTVVKFIRKGYNCKKIEKKIKIRNGIDEICEIAKLRIRARDKFSVTNLYFDEYGLRYSTPEIVGQYRANRIKEKTIADLSCGVGLQAIFYSFTNKEVLGIDISKKRIKYAKLNAKAYNANNIRFISENSLTKEIYSMVRDYDILYSDPARNETEKERSLESLLPPPLKIMEIHGKERNYVFDLPPQISLKKIPKTWGKEFISINGRINRFTAYIGDTKTHDRVAVTLPSGKIFWSDKEINWEYYDNLKIKEVLLSDFIYIVDESLYYSHLLEEFSEEREINYLQIGKRRTLATGSLKKDPFLRAFDVICKSTSLEDIIRCMKMNSIGQVTLRFKVSPEEYWATRKKIEEKLNGKVKGSIFHIGDIWVGTKNVT